MIMRAVTVTIAAGKEADYWAWAREIVELWDAKGVRRAGGPYRSREGEQEVGLWLTLHDDMTEIEDEFRTLYAEGAGKALIERRPALVSDTTVAYYDSWPFDS
jgi:hypothetical protein